MKVINSMSIVLTALEMEIGKFVDIDSDTIKVYDISQTNFFFNVNAETRNKLNICDKVNILCLLNDNVLSVDVLLVLAKKVGEELETIFSISESWTKKRILDVLH